MPRIDLPHSPHPALLRFSERLRELRSLRGISQERLAMEAGLARSYVGEVERAQRNISLINITKLAEALDVEPSRLLESIGSRIF
ncbi:MAG: helix-turn-helix transcriptional regulator [Pseudoxanthomonas suwonensis]|nr:helix-turn-helix transcriptional regulator [Pseudoxanthomonas suwonensis]